MRGIVEFDDRTRVLRCCGEEDRATQGSRRRSFTRAIRCQGDVIADLGELVFADASLMLDLAALAGRLRTRGRTLELRRAQPQIATLIQLSGLHRLAVSS